MVKSGKTPRWCSHSTMVPSKLHHGAVKTPPWWSGTTTMVKFLRHHGEIPHSSVVNSTPRSPAPMQSRKNKKEVLVSMLGNQAKEEKFGQLESIPYFCYMKVSALLRKESAKFLGKSEQCKENPSETLFLSIHLPK